MSGWIVILKAILDLFLPLLLPLIRDATTRPDAEDAAATPRKLRDRLHERVREFEDRARASGNSDPDRP